MEQLSTIACWSYSARCCAYACIRCVTLSMCKCSIHPTIKNTLCVHNCLAPVLLHAHCEPHACHAPKLQSSALRTALYIDLNSQTHLDHFEPGHLHHHPRTHHQNHRDHHDQDDAGNEHPFRALLHNRCSGSRRTLHHR